MADKIECPTHGESFQTFTCSHLVGESAGRGFNRDEPTEDNLFPDAWCDDCELIRAAHGGWNQQSKKLCKMVLLCSGCYQRSRIRNSKPTVGFDDLKDLRWKCGSCEEWHYGPILDVAFEAPDYWGDEEKKASKLTGLLPKMLRGPAKTFLTEDLCAIEGNGYFMRGLIYLPIIGCGETFRWGVWGSLSEENFEMVRSADEDGNSIELPAMFSWLSTSIPGYPDTLNLKMYAHFQEPDVRPSFELELSDHPLAQEYHFGIIPQRVREITLRQTGANAV
jgi:hypothetical protein